MIALLDVHPDTGVFNLVVLAGREESHDEPDRAQLHEQITPAVLYQAQRGRGTIVVDLAAA